MDVFLTETAAWFRAWGGVLADHVPVVLAMALLLTASALFSASETALFSLTPDDLARLRRLAGLHPDDDARASRRVLPSIPSASVALRGGRGFSWTRTGARAALTLHDELQRLLLTMLFGNMAVNISFFALAGDLGGEAARAGLPGADMAFGFGSLAAIILFGEVIPKNVAIVVRTPMVCFSAPALLVWHRLTARPLARVGALARFGERLAGVRATGGAPRRAELRMLVEFSHDDGVISTAEHALIDGVLDFPGVRMRELMTHRVDAASVDADLPTALAVTLALETGRTRLPVRHPGRDEWLGWVDARRLVIERATGRVEQWMHPPTFVSELDRADLALAKLHRENTAMAFVVDERGAITGLATVSDLWAELFGALGDREAFASDAAREEDGGYVLPGTASVRDWRAFFQAEGDWPDCATIGGLVTWLLGHSPREGEEATWRGVRLRVVRAQRRRVREVWLGLAEEEASDADEEA